jgi:hypothetical protein
MKNQQNKGGHDERLFFISAIHENVDRLFIGTAIYAMVFGNAGRLFPDISPTPRRSYGAAAKHIANRVDLPDVAQGGSHPGLDPWQLLSCAYVELSRRWLVKPSLARPLRTSGAPMNSLHKSPVRWFSIIATIGP